MKSPVRRAFSIPEFLIVGGLSFLYSLPVHAKSMRKDLVMMTNGDRFTGEVKSLQNGVLYVKTDYVADNIGVDWAQVQRVESSAVYQITLINGVHVTGKIKRESSDELRSEDFSVQNTSGTTRVPASSVAEISGQKENFWHQLSGSIDAGYSFTSGNSQTTINNDARVRYVAPNWITGAALSNSFSGQTGASRTNRTDVTIAIERFLSHNSYVGLLNDYLHSTQQDLQLRATLGGGYGRYWIRTNTGDLRWIAGTVYAWESFRTVSRRPSDSNAEGLVGVVYDAYRFKFGEVHVQAFLFPGLSDSGRIRAMINNSLNIRLINNFYLKLGFWDNYDSRPPATAKNNELGVTSSIGWSF